jgi:hypothetical protein
MAGRVTGVSGLFRPVLRSEASPKSGQRPRLWRYVAACGAVLADGSAYAGDGPHVIQFRKQGETMRR